MARPIATTPTIAPFLRGSSLCIRLSWRGVKYPTPVLVKGVQASHVAKNGYLNAAYPDYLSANETLAAASTRLENAAAIALKAGDVTEARIKAEYTRLTKETVEAAAVAATKERRKQRMITDVKHIDAEYSLPAIEEEIAELEALLIVKKKERDNIKKFLNLYIDDSLIALLESYKATRKTTNAETTKSSFDSFVETVKQFDATAKIETVGELWLTNFQTWLIETPSKKPIYATPSVNGKRVKGKLLYYKIGETRKNSTVESYISNIKTVLKYYESRPELLPAETKINDTYKRFTFELPMREDNVMTLEESELFDLFQFQQNRVFGTGEQEQERAIDILLFLCATSLRVSDLAKVTPAAIKNNTINLIAKKTKKHTIKVSIPLNPISTAILEKYGYDMRNCNIAYPKINRRIREVLNANSNIFPSLQVEERITKHSGLIDVGTDSKRADIIGTHSGRRTFINLCLDYNVPLNKIMGATGHTDVQTLMIYANKRKDANKFMKNIFQFNPAEREDYKLLAETIS